MKGRTLAIGFLVALLGFVGIIFWLGATGGGTAGAPHGGRPLAAPSASADAGVDATGR